MASEEFRALVVEDDPSWQQILVEILGDYGLKVDLAADLDAAVRLLKDRPHRLAVLDLSLGGRDHHNQDGLQVLEAVLRHDPGCIALFLTGYATVELAVKVLKQGKAHTLFQKENFRRIQFLEAVDQALVQTPFSADSWASGAATSQISSAPAGDRGVLAESGPIKCALLVEDDAGWRQLLAELLEEAGYRVDQCRSAVEAMGRLKIAGYEVAVVDLSLASSFDPDSNLDGYRILDTTRRAHIPTIVVSGYASVDRIEAAYLENKLFACLEKQDFDRGAFLNSLQDLESAPYGDSSLNALTAREREVLGCLVRGLTNKEIAARLYVSPNTVKRHLKSIFEKMGVSTRAAASAIAIQGGFRVD